MQQPRNPKLIDVDFTPVEVRAVTGAAEPPEARAAVNQLQQSLYELTQKLQSVEEERDLLAQQVAGGRPMNSPNAELCTQVEGLRKALAESETRAQAAQTQLANLRLARDASQAQNRELSQKLEQSEMELAELRDLLEERSEQSNSNVEESDEVATLREEKRELAARLEAQRLETIDLAARFLETQDQIRNVSASLAEARLLAKATGGRPAERVEAVPEAIPMALAVPEPFAVPSAQSALREMRRCYQAYARQPDDLSHLNELHCIVESLAEAMGRSGLTALQRITTGLATLVQELYQFPEQLTGEALGTVVEAIEFLTTALKLRDLRQLRDPAEVTVCVVDDDSATCECLLMAMEAVSMQAVSFREPSEALCELAKSECDLIILDVQMPGMDGFELCSAVRQQGHHQHTPVLFVTGQTEPEIRARSILSGGNDFMTKPFMLCELGLKSLLLTAKAQLHMV